MDLHNYEIINPRTNNKKPFFNKDGFFIFNTDGKNYRYYLECATTNENNYDRNYYLLLSDSKFNDNCRLCRTDSYGRVHIKLRGEIKKYINDESNYRGNVDIELKESCSNYDVWELQ